MTGACSWDGCGKTVHGRVSDERTGRSIGYCARHEQMARDGFLHHVTSSKGSYVRGVGSERFRFVGGKQLIGEYGTGGHAAPQREAMLDWMFGR
jgi:hypothetical protein